jgi:hypothetical protein
MPQGERKKHTPQRAECLARMGKGSCRVFGKSSCSAFLSAAEDVCGRGSCSVFDKDVQIFYTHCFVLRMHIGHMIETRLPVYHSTNCKYLIFSAKLLTELNRNALMI